MSMFDPVEEKWGAYL